jgi:hypothetical protein
MKELEIVIWEIRRIEGIKIGRVGSIKIAVSKTANSAQNKYFFGNIFFYIHFFHTKLIKSYWVRFSR